VSRAVVICPGSRFAFDAIRAALAGKPWLPRLPAVA
jgi:hypothetical protein